MTMNDDHGHMSGRNVGSLIITLHWDIVQFFSFDADHVGYYDIR